MSSTAAAEAGEYYRDGRGARLHASTTSARAGGDRWSCAAASTSAHWMHANQAIYRAGGGVEVFRTEIQFHFYNVGYEWGGSYWKVHNPLSMEIWPWTTAGAPSAASARGRRSSTASATSSGRGRCGAPPPPRLRGLQPGPGRRRLRLGTSVGWSDIYPSDYDRQWVSVAGLRGCYAFVMRVDPQNLLYESNERNNRSVAQVRLPYRGGPQRC